MRSALVSSRRTGGNLFAHFSEIRSAGFKNLAEGQKVTFEVKMGPKGKQIQPS
jgi:CspA family cold shock protein